MGKKRLRHDGVVSRDSVFSGKSDPARQVPGLYLESQLSAADIEQFEVRYILRSPHTVLRDTGNSDLVAAWRNGGVAEVIGVVDHIPLLNQGSGSEVVNPYPPVAIGSVAKGAAVDGKHRARTIGRARDALRVPAHGHVRFRGM